MSTIASNYADTTEANGYFHNLGLAARAFLGALLASKPYQAIAEKEAGVIAGELYARPRQRDISRLNREAARYETTMPNLAAELRSLAMRD